MKNRNDPGENLRRGREILDPLLTTHGFGFVVEASGRSSGGEFASGEYVRGDRRLELHFRHSLGLVRYHVGPISMTHGDYMRALGREGQHRYPGFSQDPLDAFRDLRSDLEAFCGDFLAGAGDRFQEAAAWGRSASPGHGNEGPL